MAQPQSEKRSTRRFSLELPVKVVDQEQGVTTAQTRDVSSRGVYVYLGSEIAEGVPMEFVMTLPTEIKGMSCAWRNLMAARALPSLLTDTIS